MMDACACVGRIVLADVVINYIKRHGAYVIRYKNKVQLLEEENKRLVEKKETIQEMVDTATNCGKVIKTEVSSWLKDAEDMEGDIANMLHPQENRESFKCFKGCMCPDLMWRHKRGKDADDRKSEVTKLISRGELLQTSPVARSASFQSEPLFDSSQYYTTFSSRASVFEEIMEALKDSRVDMIAVHGPGGAGKTTMVKEVAKEAKKQGIFDKIVIAVLSKDPNTSKLQEDLAPQLDLKYEQNSELGRADELRKALSNGKRQILVILDDLWQALDLKAIGIPISGPGPKGCKIMLTSRKEEVLKGMNVHSPFFIDYLKEEEAWELFRKVTGDFGVDECTARKVCEKCADLPIAIVAVGVALKGQEEEVWRNALSQLEKSPLKYIEGIEGVELAGYTPLKLSYDFLKDEGAKSCFLLCCLFPEDAEISIDDLVRYSFALRFLGREGDTLKDARDKVQDMVYMLKRSCLLLNGENKNCVKMHDVMRDLAIVITWEKQTVHGGGHDWPGGQQFMVNHDIRVLPNNDAWKHHTAISLRINYNFTFPCGVLDCPLLHTFVLEKPGYSSSHIIPKNFFQDYEFHHLMDKVFHLLVDKVTVLKLRRIPHLEGLFLHGRPQLKVIPSGGGPFSKLTFLEIDNCPGMKFLFSSSIARALQQLQELKVSCCSKMEQIVGLVDHHHGEKVVTDETIIFSRLQHLNLSGLPEFKSFYPRMEKTTSFTAAAEFIFDEKVLFPVLTCLMIDELPVKYIWNKQAIQFLDRSNKVSFSQLERFYLKNCDTLANVFPSNMLPRLQNLKMLNVENCPHLTLLVEDLNSNIQSPTIKPKFNDVFPKLIDLWLCDLPKLMKTWLSDEDCCSYDNFVDLCLKRISIIRCGSLKHAFSAFAARHLVRIQYLCIIGCPRMEVIVSKVRGEGKIDDRTIKFNKLEELFLEDLSNLRSFYESNSEAPHLFNYQDACPNVKTLYLRDLKNTREIQLWDLDSTQEHPHKVRLIGCQVSTKVLSRHMRRSFRIINNLSLKNCQGFKHVIDLDDTINVCEELFVDVERLKLNDLPELVFLWNKNLHKIESLQNLKYINIGKCPQMKSLFTHSMATTLQHLKTLVVECCGMMEEIIIIEENNINTAKEEKVTWQVEFLKLEYLILIGLPNLKNFCNDERGSFSFSSLRGVSVKNCPKMKTFVSGQICLPPRMMRAVVGDEKVEITNLNAYFEARNEDSNHMGKIVHWGGSLEFTELWKKERSDDYVEIWNHIYRGYESKSKRESE